MNLAPMTNVPPPQTAKFAPAVTPAQARAALMTPEQRADAIAKIDETAKKFESSFLSTMMGTMFNGVDMGGGQGGDMFKSVMMEAIGKKVVSAGGIGLAKQVQAEMLKMQGLS